MSLSRKRTKNRKGGVCSRKAQDMKYHAAFNAVGAKRSLEGSSLSTHVTWHSCRAGASTSATDGHGWTSLNDYHTSSELSRKWHEAKENNHAQATGIYDINLMQNLMSKVHKQQDHHHVPLVASKEVLRKHLTRLRQQVKGSKLGQAQTTNKDKEVSMSLGGARRAHSGVKQVTRQNVWASLKQGII